MNRICWLLIVLLLSTGAACRKQPSLVPANTPVTSSPVETVPAPGSTTPATSASPSENEPVLGTDPVEYNGYRLTREVKTVKDIVAGRDTETDYGVLKFRAKTLMIFDADAFSAGNRLAFGLFPFLGTEHKQLYVERTGYREWEQWLIDLHPRFRVLYHSTDFGFWGGMQVMDIDGDGIYELSTRVTTYYMFADLPMAASPEVFALLKYDHRTKKYVPANYLFQDEALKGIKEDLASLPSKSGIDYRQQVLNILLANLYAGKEREGGEFFDKEYSKPDKAELKRKIKQKLAREPVFQYLHPHRTS